jgi:hypothetical protein
MVANYRIFRLNSAIALLNPGWLRLQPVKKTVKKIINYFSGPLSSTARLWSQPARKTVANYCIFRRNSTMALLNPWWLQPQFVKKTTEIFFNYFPTPLSPAPGLSFAESDAGQTDTGDDALC